MSSKCRPPAPTFSAAGRLPALALVSALLLLLLGCMETVVPKTRVALPEPAAKTGPAEVQDALRRAETAQIEKRYPEALRLFEEFLKTNPDSPLADQAWFGLGEIHQRLGQPGRAMEAFENLIRHRPQSPFAVEARLRLAELKISAGRFEEARALLGPLPAGPAQPRLEARALLLSSRAFLGDGRRLEALESLVKVYQGEDALDRAQARELILEIIGPMPVQELKQAQKLIDQAFPGGQIAYLIAYREYQAGRTQEARRQLKQFLSAFPGHELTGPVNELSRAIEAGHPLPPLALPTRPAARPRSNPAPKPRSQMEPQAAVASTNLACLLPLTGEWAVYGQEVLRGVRLAFQLYRPKTDGFRAQLIELDSAGDPNRAAQAMEKTAARRDIAAMIGPLTSAEAEPTAARAEALGMPMVSLSQKEGLVQTGKYIFRLCLTPEEQARTMARYAVQTLGLTRLAILHPTDDYGTKMRDAFWDEAARLKAGIVGVQSYKPGTTDFSDQVEALAGLDKAARRAEGGRSRPAGFQAVFLPDDDQVAVMIAPYFIYYDVPTRLLGPALWHTPRLLRAAARDMQGAVFPTSFFAGADRPEVRRFVEAYGQEHQGRDPGRFEAYGFDAATMLLTLMDTRQAVTREDLVQELRRGEVFPGVTGSFSFDQNGELKTAPILLKVEGESFTLVR